MDIGLYRRYLQQFVEEAIRNSDGSVPKISTYLWNYKKPGKFSRHRTEKNRALKDARQAFDEHQHWPLKIILSHLGVEGNRPEGKY